MNNSGSHQPPASSLSHQAPTLTRPSWVSCSFLADLGFQIWLGLHPPQGSHWKLCHTTLPKVLKVACFLTATWTHNVVLLSLCADKPSRDAGSSYGLREALSRGETSSQSRLPCFCCFKSPHLIFCAVSCNTQLCKFINHTLISTQFHRFGNGEKGGFQPTQLCSVPLRWYKFKRCLQVVSQKISSATFRD